MIRQSRRIVTTKPAASIVYAKAKVSHPYFDARSASEIADCGYHAGVDLCGVVRRCVFVVPERYEEDVRDTW